MTIQSVCVFCGASTPPDPLFMETARAVGKLLAAEGIELVYGAGRVGLMGALADACLEGGGRVVGIIPGHLQDLEVGHNGLHELEVVEDMMERKRRMIARSDAFLILGGGFGTLDELFEVLTFKQLRLHLKPIVILDTAGYWSPLIRSMEHMAEVGFIRQSDLHIYRVVDSLEQVVGALRAPQAPVPDPRSKVDPSFKE
ncbi:MAG: TIGR00730 family Rossman fold protein [Myxococcota bacterium]